MNAAKHGRRRTGGDRYSTGLHRQVRCETTRALPTSHTWA